MSRLNHIEIVTYTMVFLCLTIGMILSFVNIDFFESKFAVEDGIIEYTTALVLFFVTVLSIGRIFNKNLKKNIFWIITTSLIALAFLFGAGEEISWGQRIFGIESNEFFKEKNAQQETNLHNLVVGETKINKLIFGQLLTVVLVLYLLVLPLLFNYFEKFKNLINKLGVPVPKMHHAIAFILATIIVAIMPSGKRWEIYEFAFAFFFLIILLFPRNTNIYYPE